MTYPRRDRIPYPVATVVTYRGTKFLIESINLDAGIDEGNNYSLLGHKELRSEGRGVAWIDHDLVSLEHIPSEWTWKLLREARED